MAYFEMIAEAEKISRRYDFDLDHAHHIRGVPTRKSLRAWLLTVLPQRRHSAPAPPLPAPTPPNNATPPITHPLAHRAF